MKKYIKPEIELEYMIDDEDIIATSGGVETGGKLGRNFYGDDVSYSKQIDFSDSESIW